MKNFQTVVADHRVSLKGYLSSSFVQPAMKVGPRLMSQLHTLLSIVEELESHYPMFSLSSGGFIIQSKNYV